MEDKTVRKAVAAMRDARFERLILRRNSLYAQMKNQTFYVGYVDLGTMEYIKSFNVQIKEER